MLREIHDAEVSDSGDKRRRHLMQPRGIILACICEPIAAIGWSLDYLILFSTDNSTNIPTKEVEHGTLCIRYIEVYKYK